MNLSKSKMKGVHSPIKNQVFIENGSKNNKAQK